MDFEVTEEQRTLCDTLRALGSQLNDDLVERDLRSEFSRSAWDRCAAVGIPGLPVAVEYGGAGADALTSAMALEAFSYGCRDEGLTFSLCAHMQTCVIPIWLFGTAEQRRRFLPSLCDGTAIGGNCMTEPSSGSDAYGMSTRAVRDGGAYVLDGSKTFVTNGPIADLLVVYALTNMEYRQFGGISAFIVQRNTPGVQVGRRIEKMGLRTSTWSEVTFDGCRVPIENRLGEEGGATAIFNESMEWERVLLYTATLGRMQEVLDRTIRYARERKQFGQSIGKFQAVAGQVVEMKAELEASRLLLYRAAWLKRVGQPAAAEISLAKLYVSEARVRSSLCAIQVHGGYGYATEFELERELRNAVAGRIASGTSEIQRHIVARAMGL